MGICSPTPTATAARAAACVRPSGRSYPTDNTVSAGSLCPTRLGQEWAPRWACKSSATVHCAVRRARVGARRAPALLRHRAHKPCPSGLPRCLPLICPFCPDQSVCCLVPNVEPLVRPNVQPLVRPNVQPLVGPNVQPLVGPNVEPLVGPNVQPLVGPHGPDLGTDREVLEERGPNPPPESANLAANESASESATCFTRLGGRDQKFGGWHKIRPIMQC